MDFLFGRTPEILVIIVIYITCKYVKNIHECLFYWITPHFYCPQFELLEFFE